MTEAERQKFSQYADIHDDSDSDSDGNVDKVKRRRMTTGAEAKKRTKEK